MKIKIEPEKCTECGRCSAACSLVKTGRINPLDARISIIRNWPEVPQVNICRFEDCDDKPCIEACPFDAIKVVDGKVAIIAENCRGCKKCVSVCPYNAIRMDKGNKLAVKCDLCGGNPACVPECVTGALTLEVE